MSPLLSRIVRLGWCVQEGRVWWFLGSCVFVVYFGQKEPEISVLLRFFRVTVRWWWLEGGFNPNHTLNKGQNNLDLRIRGKPSHWLKLNTFIVSTVAVPTPTLSAIALSLYRPPGRCALAHNRIWARERDWAEPLPRLIRSCKHCFSSSSKCTR